MSDDQKVKITVKDNGSLRVEGDFAILDVEGNEIPHEGAAAGLCRCGHSANKPFCDGSHKDRFESVVRAPKGVTPGVSCGEGRNARAPSRALGRG